MEVVVNSLGGNAALSTMRTPRLPHAIPKALTAQEAADAVDAVGDSHHGQLGLGEERMHLPVADAVQDHRFPSAFGTRHQVVRILLRGRH